MRNNCKVKILYGIQGTGNGHLSRAQELLPYLKEFAHVDVLISGMHYDLKLNQKVKYRKQGLGFFFGKRGGIDILKTIRYMNICRFYKDIKDVDVDSYDLVISDFEPVTAWACKIRKKFCLAMSHQSSMLVDKVPMPDKKSIFAMFLLKNYAPANESICFHFQEYGDNMFTPVIRKQIRELKIDDHGYYLVYLPAYCDQELIKVLSVFKNIKWKVFSKHTSSEYTNDNIEIYMPSSDGFINAMASCSGVLCGAGFETPAEALFLSKKLIVVPMNGQYEQACNAEALSEMGVPVITDFALQGVEYIGKYFINNTNVINVNYPDNAKIVGEYLLRNFVAMDVGKTVYSVDL